MIAFPPARRRGLILHGILIVVLSLVSTAAFALLFQTQVSLRFAIYLVLFVLTVLPVPILAYRFYALTRANYLLDRNTLRLVWGLRVEEIPVTDVEWLRPVHGLLAPLAPPRLWLPGGLLGVTSQADIGDVEFMAAEIETLILVATARRVYAISPQDPAAFTSAFQKIIEMGSLESAAGHSEYPSFVMARAWELALVRYLWLAGIFLNLGAFVWVSILISSLREIPLGFGPGGVPLEPVPGAQLILLPILGAVLFVAGWLLGLFFFRRAEQQVLALTIWASSVLTSLFFLAAIYFIITTPV